MSAQRSVQATLVNQTSNDLQLSSSNLLHGIFGNQPPNTITAGQSGSWEAESQGLATGTQGDVIYNFANNTATLVTLNWDNPFVGSSSYGGSVNNPAFILTTNVVTPGNNSTVIYTLTSKA
jgi:hypothetical protein